MNDTERAAAIVAGLGKLASEEMANDPRQARRLLEVAATLAGDPDTAAGLHRIITGERGI